MANGIGRISGPLLKSNLLRNGVNLAFETDLLYLDVNNKRIGVKTSSPQYDLDVNGTIKTTNFRATTQLDFNNITISGDTISTTGSTLTINPQNGTGIVYQQRVLVGDLELTANTITNTNSGSIDLYTTGGADVNINADTNITGNLHVTGDIRSDGNIQIGDANTDAITFNADITSDIIPDQNSFYSLGSSPKRWSNIWSHTEHATTLNTDVAIVDGVSLSLRQGNILYVSKNGNDVNTGTHQNDPFLTISHALSVATSGTTVFIYPGSYTETFPLTVPVGVTVKGAGIRSVLITPTVGTKNKDCFLLNGETTIEDLSIADYFYDSINNTGYAVRLATNITVTSRSPYVRNVSVLTKGSVLSGGDPLGYNQGDAGRGAFVDGSVANSSSNKASLLFHSVTFITPNAYTIVMTNGVRVEWLNSFTYYASRGLYAYGSSAGFAGQGQTILKVSGVSGTFISGETIQYYAADGTTLLASGTIASYDNTTGKIYINGRSLGFHEYSERSGKVVTAFGDAKLSTAVKKFGTASLSLGGAGYATIPASVDFAYSLGDFTIELWAYRTTSPGVVQFLFDQRTTSPDAAPVIYLDSSNYVVYNVNATPVITGSDFPLNTWTHIAVCRKNNQTRMFVNGTKVGVTYTDNVDYLQRPITVGARQTNQLNNFTGFIDDLRVSKGIGRYDSNFTVPVGAFPNDQYTSLLCHFNGTNNSTVLIDESSLVQDVRFSGGATATKIDLADYTQFGAEVRSIASANVYGSYGAYGDGVGVLMYLIGHNFSYCGSGSDNSNTPHPEASELGDLDIYEVVQVNGAHVYYTSVNEEGDFRVGDYFYVDQYTGDVQFSSASLNILGSNGVTFVNGTDITTITPTKIETGNLRLSGNTLSSISGDVNVLSASNQINLQNNVTVSNNLTVNGNTYLNGNTTFGDNTSDAVTFIAGITSDLIPRTTESYDLGTSSLVWRKLYLGEMQLDSININDNIIQTTTTNTNLQLLASGTGAIRVEQIDINENVISTNTTNTDLNITPNGTGKVQLYANTDITGNVDVTGNFTISGNNIFGDSSSDTVSFNAEIITDIVPKTTSLYNLGSPSKFWSTVYVDDVKVGNIDITSNTIQTVSTNTNLNISGNGTGYVEIEQINISNSSIFTTIPNYDIRIASNGSGRIKLLKSTDVYGDLTVSVDFSVNGNVIIGDTTADTINFISRVKSDIIPSTTESYDLGTSSLVWRKLYAGEIQVDSINFNSNTIQTTSGTNLELIGNGTGAVRIETIDIKDNLISSNTTDTDIQINANGTGRIKLLKSTDITGDLTVSGDVTIGGNITIGDQTSDTVTFVSEVDSNIVPKLTETYDLGTSSNVWRTIYAGQILVDQLEVNNNRIQTTVSGTNLELVGNGTGLVRIESVDIDQNTITTNTNSDLILQPTGTGILRVNSNQSIKIPAGTIGDRPSSPEAGMIRYDTTYNYYEGYDGVRWVPLDGVYDVDRNTYITAELTPGANDNIFRFYASGSLISTLDSTRLTALKLDVDDITVNNNVISTNNGNKDLILSPNGTGSVKVGNIAIRDSSITNFVSNSITTVSQSGTGYVAITGTNGFVIPTGNSSQRPGYAVVGMMRYNVELKQVDVYDGATWTSAAGSSGAINESTAYEIAALSALIFG